MLSSEQEARYQELQEKIREGGRGGFMKLSQPEKDEYTELNNLVQGDERGTVPVQFVLDLLQNLYMFIKDGRDRSEIIKAKRAIQTYND